MKKNAAGYYRETFTFEGKRYDVTAKTERDLWRKVDEKKRQLEDGVDKISANMPVSKWIDKYLEIYKKPVVSAYTYRDLASRAKHYIYPEIGNRRLKDVKPADLQKIMNSVADKSKSFVEKLCVLIKGAFRQARIDRVLIYDPAESLVTPKVTDSIGRPVTEDERRHILNVCKTHKHGLWVLFMLYTGARPVETRMAKWEDVDLKNKRITIHSAKTDFGDRIVPINPQLLPLLKGGEGYIFTNLAGGPTTKEVNYKWWVSIKRAIDIDMGAKTFRRTVQPETSMVADDLVPYCLRHTCATDWYTAGVPINTIREFLGHKSIATTTRVYVKISSQAFNDAASRIAAFEQGRKESKVVPIKKKKA